jgi:hypothetical protein
MGLYHAKVATYIGCTTRYMRVCVVSREKSLTGDAIEVSRKGRSMPVIGGRRSGHDTLLQPIMSANPNPSTSTLNSNFVSIFNTTSTLKYHKRKTKKDLALHPLLPRLQARHSPEVVFTVFREQIPAFNQSQNDDDSLINILRSLPNCGCTAWVVSNCWPGCWASAVVVRIVIVYRRAFPL